MNAKEEHKPLLKNLGLKNEDFERFDGEFVRYEYDCLSSIQNNRKFIFG